MLGGVSNHFAYCIMLLLESLHAVRSFQNVETNYAVNFFHGESGKQTYNIMFDGYGGCAFK